MSFKKQTTKKESLSEYMSTLITFTQLARRLLLCRNIHAFQIWLDKLDNIDRRALVLYLRRHKDKLPDEQLELARKHFAAVKIKI